MAHKLTLLLFMCSLFFACASPQQAVQNSKSVSQPTTANANDNAQAQDEIISANTAIKESAQALADQKRNKQPEYTGIAINYKNASSDLFIVLDPSMQAFSLDLSGMRSAVKDTVYMKPSENQAKNLADAQQMMASFRSSQDALYQKKYDLALEKINESLAIYETADAHALKGTIYFMQGNKNAAAVSWNKAVQLNPEIRVPDIPELNAIIKDLKDNN